MIYLASLSPRRAELLDQININYQKVAVNVDETAHPHEMPQDYVMRLALAKARAGRLALSTTQPVLGADTTIVCNKQIFGKPLDENDAKQMLRDRLYKYPKHLRVVGLKYLLTMPAF
ncbi:Maf-like protein [Candidatus Thiomargarita nelsonii]|uniref:Maf-like protein n=1 Tax=Candidatus Thiomargarita nelsonii TaxID=1003181 RepID=A0A176RXI9_9GAMM|nr:Maf-like protein [Candidatus Thiomargarita nelsonii]